MSNLNEQDQATIEAIVKAQLEHYKLIQPTAKDEVKKYWDYLRCIDNSAAELTLDKIYKVIRIDNDGCYVITDDGGDEFGYYPHRFDVATIQEYTAQQQGDVVEDVKEGFDIEVYSPNITGNEGFRIHIGTKFKMSKLMADDIADKIKQLLQTL